MNIFLAEDHGPDVFLIKEALQRAGICFELQHCADGEEAIDELLGTTLEVRPDLILLDINLPKRTGFDVLMCLRENSALASVPVIILTSSRSPRDKMEADRLGASAFISKPPDLQEFLASIGNTAASLLRGEKASGMRCRHRVYRARSAACGAVSRSGIGSFLGRHCARGRHNRHSARRARIDVE